MTKKIHFTRSLAVIRLKNQLEQHSYPRIHMSIIVALTGGIGLLSSFLMLHAGIDSMVLRYPLALLFAYMSFLFLLWLWLRSKAEDYVDIADSLNFPSMDSSVDPTSYMTGGGGDFGGAGASGTFDDFSNASISETDSVSSSLGDSAGSLLDADELAIPIIAIVLAVGLALASLYIVYLAPALFAELLFDGVLSYSLYRHLRIESNNHWISTAFERTILPFGITGIFLVVISLAMTHYAPGANSIGEVINYDAHATANVYQN
jgi:hypothetical protein